MSEDTEMYEQEPEVDEVGETEESEGFALDGQTQPKREPKSFSKLIEELVYGLQCGENEQFCWQVKDRGLSIAVYPSNYGGVWKDRVLDCRIFLVKYREPLLVDGEPQTYPDGNQRMVPVMDTWCAVVLKSGDGILRFILTMKDGKLKQAKFFEQVKGSKNWVAVTEEMQNNFPEGQYDLAVIDYEKTKDEQKPLIRLCAEMYSAGVRRLRNVFLTRKFKKHDKTGNDRN